MSFPAFNEIDYPTTFDFGGYNGSYDYKYYGADGETNRHWYALGTVSQLYDFGPLVDADNTSGETVYTDMGEVLRFPNGYTIHLIFGVVYSGSMSGSIQFYTGSRMYDENGEQVTKPTLSGVTFNQGAWGASARSWLYGHFPMPLGMILLTKYYPQTPENAAHPSGLAFKLLGFNGMNEDMWRSSGAHMDALASGRNINSYDDITHYYSSQLEKFITQTFTEHDFLTLTPTGMDNLDNWLHERGNPYEGPAWKPRGGDGPAGSDDTSGPGGGDGNYDDTSDPIDFPDIPNNGAIDSGAVSAHRVAQTTLISIMNDLWDTSLFDIDTWQKAITDPMDAIVSLHALPFTPDVEADPNDLYIGNMNMHVQPPKVTSQYKVIDFAAKSLPEYWGSALDYSPYVKVEIFLPFCGCHELKTEDVVNSTMTIRYHVDVLTGDCIAFIKCGLSVLYRFRGNCKMQIPLTSQTNTAADTLRRAPADMMIGAATGGGAGAVRSAMTSAANVVAHKIITKRSGNIEGSTSLMDDFTPYLIIHRPKQSLAAGYNSFKGYPSNITSQLSALKGYTEVEHINLSVAGATDAELEEIKSLLQSGVII